MYEKLFEEGVERHGTNCVKWDLCAQNYHNADAISLGVADMDFKSPETVTQAIVERAMHGAYGYTIECDDDRQAVVDWMQTRHQTKIEKDWLIFTPGVINSMRVSISLFTQPGDRVAILGPVYGPFHATIVGCGCIPVRCPMLYSDEAGWQMNLEALEAAFRSGVKVMMLCNPHNPLGRVWTRAELETLVALCKRYGVQIICDEIHADLEMPGYKNTCLLNVDPDAVVLISATKTFNLAALCHSSVIIRDEDVRRRFMDRFVRVGGGNINLFGQLAQRTAYRTGAQWLDELLVYLDGNRQFVEEFLKQQLPMIKCSKLQATYLMWLDLRALGMKHEDMVAFCYRAGFGVVDGKAFGEEADGFVRVNIATPRKNLEKAFTQLKQAIDAR